MRARGRVTGAGPRVVFSSQAGFTFIELIVVITILGSILMLVMPSMPMPGAFSLGSDARKAASIIRYADEAATRKREYFRLWVDASADTIRLESSSDGTEFTPVEEKKLRGFAFSSGVDIEEVAVRSFGSVKEGEVYIVFNPTFGAEPFSLYLGDEDGKLTLTYNPYSGRVRVLEGHV